MSSNDSQDPLRDERIKDQKRVSDYLAAPRRKRRSYIVTAFTQKTASEHRNGLEHFLRTNFKNMAIAHCHDAEELKKAFGRQVVMLIYDDEFMDLNTGLQMISGLKRKKATVPCSVLFLTRQKANLIQAYNEILLPFHESDDYLETGRFEPNALYSKVKGALSQQNRRRSRRYRVDLPLTFYSLNDDKDVSGRLTDLSVHGGLLEVENGRLFKEGEQIKIALACAGYLEPGEGDFLKISARVRRVQISGNKAGISFEHVSEKQLFRLTTFLSAIVNEQISKSVLTQKLKSVR